LINWRRGIWHGGGLYGAGERQNTLMLPQPDTAHGLTLTKQKGGIRCVRMPPLRADKNLNRVV
jgi:hypothetical protein